MTLYIFLIFLGALLISFPQKSWKRTGSIFFFILAFFSMFRGINVGLDTWAYYQNSFTNVFDLNSNISYDYEYISIAVSSFIRRSGLNPRCYLWFLSIVTFVFLYLSAKKYNVSSLLVAFFFLILNYFALSLNVARQIASVSIILYAFHFLELKNKKRFYYFLFVLLAAAIHISSIVYLPVYFIRYIRISLKANKVPVLFATVLLVFVYVQINKDNFINVLFANIDQINIYQHLGEETGRRTFSIMGLIASVISVVLCLFICLASLRENKDKVFPVILLAAIILEVVFSAYSGNIGRALYGFSFIKFIAFADYFKTINFHRRGNKEVMFIVVTIYYSYIMMSSLSNGSYGVVPYYMTL